jgi:hypothetical protein
MKNTVLISIVLLGTAAWAQRAERAVAPVDASPHAEVDAAVKAEVDGQAHPPDDLPAEKRPATGPFRKATSPSNPSGSAPVKGSGSATKDSAPVSFGAAPAPARPPASTASWPARYQEPEPVPVVSRGNPTSKNQSKNQAADSSFETRKDVSNNSSAPKARVSPGMSPEMTTPASAFEHDETALRANPFSSDNNFPSVISSTRPTHKQSRRSKSKSKPSGSRSDRTAAPKSQK